MRLAKSIGAVSGLAEKARLSGRSVGFVPTMGYLHDGHLGLIRAAARENDVVVVSIFVNPTQFGPNEDFKKYPSDLRRDMRLLKKEKVSILFCPKAQDLYPQGYGTYVEVKGLSSKICGKFRPGHFRGVVTVVTKLFNIVRPHRAYFGQKDAQQAVIIKKAVKDLNLPVQIRVLPTKREKDGLAMSSRNTYLNTPDRKNAGKLYKALLLAKKCVNDGQKDSAVIISKVKRFIKNINNAKVDYVSIVDPQTLEDIKRINKKAMIAIAVRIAGVRLIDNVIVTRNP